MNNFEAKYIKIASTYLDEKMKLLKFKSKKETQKSHESKFKQIVSSLFSS